MLSNRGARLAASQDIPWRFPPGSDNRYDKVSNPSGVIQFTTAENVSVKPLLQSRVIADPISIVYMKS